MDKLYVIDLDRTIIGFDEVMELAEKTCEQAGIDFAAIKEAQLKAAEDGIPYSPLRTIDEMGEDKLAQFKQRFVELAESEKLIFDDARRYMEKLEQKGLQYLIMTFATEADWQKLKLEAAGLIDVPHVITFNQRKGEDIAGWRTSDGKFKPPVTGVVEAKEIIFIDDRLRVFEGLPEGCEGYHIDRFGYEKNGVLPEKVSRISSFDEIIDKI